MIVWSILLVVVFKYLIFILRADNRGEGGVLALLALVLQRERRTEERKRRMLLIVLGVFGTALLYGDGVITPAISVLGAMEGLEVVTPAFASYVVAITVGILLSLFAVQRGGTARLGKAFGPITLVWFVAIGTLGLVEIIQQPGILAAVNPWYAVRFFAIHGFVGFAILGSVFLAVTGAEALYADLGHFGKRPIRVAFFAVVLPSLLLNYLGQGALLLRDPSAVSNPFYLLAPRVLLYPLLVVATMAAIVASQALISGAFSLAQQSVQLGFSPRLTIIHTSEREYGQIYVPEINKALMVGTLLIVIGFQSSSALGCGVRYRRDGHDGDHDDSVHRRGARAVALAAVEGTGSRRDLPHVRHRVPGRQRSQDRKRWLGSAGDRARRLHADDDVEVRPRHSQRHHAPRQLAARSAAGGHRTQVADARAGNGGVHDVGQHRRARRAHASSQAQQGAARAGHSPVGEHRENARRQRRRVE